MGGRAALPAVLLAAGLTGAAGAQQTGQAARGGEAFDPRILDACLAVRQGDEGGAGCIGIAVSLCLGDAPVIEAERATGCRQREADQWTDRLDAVLALLREGAARSDTAEGAAAGAGRAAALESAHSTWTAWREAECAWRQALAGGGDLAALDCRLRETALRALALERIGAEGEGP